MGNFKRMTSVAKSATLLSISGTAERQDYLPDVNDAVGIVAFEPHAWVKNALALAYLTGAHDAACGVIEEVTAEVLIGASLALTLTGKILD